MARRCMTDLDTDLDLSNLFDDPEEEDRDDEDYEEDDSYYEEDDFSDDNESIFNEFEELPEEI